MAKSAHIDYFESFLRIAKYGEQASGRILEIFKNYDRANLESQLAEVHDIEHAADDVTHEVYTTIVREFITPIDREDILQLVNELDDVVDHIEDIMQRLYMYNVKTILPEAIDMMETIQKSTVSLREALEDFPNYKKSQDIMEHLIDVNTYEEQIDHSYIEVVHMLFSTPHDPLEVIAWTNTLDRIERCADILENAADVINTIVAKNS